MARLFPLRSETSAQDGQPRVVDLEGEDADAVFSALSSTTARQIYSCLDDDPGTPSDIADAIDSSIQNVRYHLENLEEAGLVEVVDTWYSSRGNEMSVYATTDGPLIVTSDESAGSQLKTALSRLIGGIGALAGGSLLVQYGLTQWIGPDSAEAWGAGAPADEAAPADDGDARTDDGTQQDGTAADGDDGGEGDETTADDESDDVADDGNGDEDGDGFGAAEADEEVDADDTSAADDVDDADDVEADDATAEDATAEDEADTEADDIDSFDTEYRTDGGDGGFENVTDGVTEVADPILATVPPGLLFFLGGLVVLFGVSAYWYWRAYQPMR
ncbi:ArsR family transcription regulator [Natrialba magadii ATCC 43099]|uniref:ArsR family transcription regulator n=1 Tax=Natrialba magadii (strain ATCC 43099 / DSM 3394 / CCM 3739 / CIP 104546 / IAM 13178 / JCM 8861 / NBRC 102185 / NCIMB 2190 / MS3) TaxID=547559 RepID=D3SS86_NATMM|nr:helix-turn-helix domain-containing protein [Natrialba magadii]ADD04812.1 ArsR family transcription regulator [Natrialba magadii ATCC 43099]ELY24479.1 ArsR family transcriptional regulator [Natrialba magadii ATCC 43099]